MSKRVLVTGGGRGIGRAVVQALAENGYKLDVVVKSVESERALNEWARTTGAYVRVFKVDLKDSASIQNLARDWSDNIWGIVNNAGVCKTMPIAEVSDYDPYEEILTTNLTSAYCLTRGLLPCLSRPGRIVNIASQLALEGRAGYGAYCASKFGLIGLTKCWAKELGAQGITVNAVCPGWVSTDMSVKDVERLASEAGVALGEYYADICSPLELKRFNTPQEVASLVCYLLSEDASGITGREMLMQTVWNQC
jgi:NAD(P)-dependent dehydrogenase (short-subunit alcohol dehydrogenase family)